MNRKLLATADVRPFGLRVRLDGRKLKRCLLCNSTVSIDTGATKYFMRATCGYCGVAYGFTADLHEPTTITIMTGEIAGAYKYLPDEDTAWLKLLLTSKHYPRVHDYGRKSP